MTFVVWEGEGSERLPGGGVGGADLCNPRGVSGVGSHAGFNLQPSEELQSEGISGPEADVSPRPPCRPARHSIGQRPEGRVQPRIAPAVQRKLLSVTNMRRTSHLQSFSTNETENEVLAQAGHAPFVKVATSGVL